MAGELHGAVGTAVGHAAMILVATLVVGMGVFFTLVEFVACDLVEAFDAEAFHLVCASLGCCLGLVHAG